jgi:tetratricopeptide (TPR) repeat protein
MSDPLRTDGSLAPDDGSAPDRDAKIEQLLLVGLDHYFAARYELAVNVWTRVLFLDRNHARARAYIERARSAMAERQRESEELLQNGVAAFNRGEGDEARRLLQEAIERGAPSDEALAVLERLNRLETASPQPTSEAAEAKPPRRGPRIGVGASVSRGVPLAAGGFAAAIVVFVAWGAWSGRIDWRSLVAFAQAAGRIDAPGPRSAAPIARDPSLPLPRRGEETLARARTLAASGHLRDALAVLEFVRATDPQRVEADRLRADIQRQLLSLGALPTPIPIERDKGERGTR